ncbi:hypothetical protein PG993_000294 [Apiospora rasikravindrae]|uniref:Rhodopsin domain-containing protein n=1 Tax=Apiospora rasikravindrae TaxID=990691 RepID=A0ABR1U860_9PEZI
MSSTTTDNIVLLYVFSVVFSIIPSVAVALRFQSRHLTRCQLFWDDWTILISLIACITTAILIIIGVAAGNMGQHIPLDGAGKPVYDNKYVIFQRQLQVQYGIDLSQLLTLGPTKISVLLLYRRIFGVDGRRFNVISLTLIGAVTIWMVVFFFTNAFQYTPVYSMWGKVPSQSHPTYSSSTSMFLAQSYADVALDAIIISLPVPLIYKLQMTIRRKLQISAVFLMGAMTTGASVARTAVQYGVARECKTPISPGFLHRGDRTHLGGIPIDVGKDYLSPIQYWPLIEAALGIVAACLPLLRPIGQVYNVRNLVLLSNRALASVFSFSSRRSSKENSNGRGVHQRHQDQTQNDKWLRPYELSYVNMPQDHAVCLLMNTRVLRNTVNSETEIVSNTEIVPPAEGIQYQASYRVTH